MYENFRVYKPFSEHKTGDSNKNRVLPSPVEKNYFEFLWGRFENFFLWSQILMQITLIYIRKSWEFSVGHFQPKSSKCHKRQISKFFITRSDLCYIELYFLSYIEFFCRSDLSLCVEPTDLCGTDGFWELKRSGLCV